MRPHKTRTCNSEEHYCTLNKPESSKYTYTDYVRDVSENEDEDFEFQEYDDTDSSIHSDTVYAIGIEEDDLENYKYGEEREMEEIPLGDIEDKRGKEMQYDEKEEMCETSFQAQGNTDEDSKATCEKWSKKAERHVREERFVFETSIKQMEEHEYKIITMQKENIELRREIARLRHMCESFCQGITSLWLENSTMRQELSDLWQEKSKLGIMIKDLQMENNDGTTASAEVNTPYGINTQAHFQKNQENETRMIYPSSNNTAGVLETTPNWFLPLEYKSTEDPLNPNSVTRYGIIPIIDIPKPGSHRNLPSSSNAEWQNDSHSDSDHTMYDKKEVQFPNESGESAKKKNKGQLRNARKTPTVEIPIMKHHSDAHVSLAQQKKKSYSFRKDKTSEVFNIAIQHGLLLPKCKHPEEQYRYDEPNFCLFHRFLGHSIKDCFSFKDLAEEMIVQGALHLPKCLLQEPASHN